MSDKTILISKSYFDNNTALQAICNNVTECVVVEASVSDLQQLNPPLDMDEASFVDSGCGVVLPKEVRKCKG